MLGIQRQRLLREKQQEKRSGRDAGENDDRHEIGCPDHLARRVDPADSIHGGFERRQNAMREGPAPGEHRRHVAAQRRGERDQHDDEGCELDPGGHGYTRIAARPAPASPSFGRTFRIGRRGWYQPNGSAGRRIPTRGTRD
jgi:hypothetical protein